MTCNKCSLQKETSRYLQRISSLQHALAKKQKEAVLIEDPIDLYYLTGLTLSVGQLFITKEDSCLFVDGRYFESASNNAPCTVILFSLEEIRCFLEKVHVKTLCFDGAKTTFQKVEGWKKNFPAISWESWDFVTQSLRVIKDNEEIAYLAKSAALLREGYDYIKTLLKEGVSEKEIAVEFTLFCLKKGAERLSFDPIIAFGENSAMPHYRAGDRKLKRGDLVLIDIGVELYRYASDMTRVLFFGPPDPFLENWLDLAIKAHDAALKIALPGVKVKELDIAARAVFKEHGVEEYFVHSLGHGVGIEVHEFPRLRFEGVDSETILEPGMVITVEPGLYLPGKGGVRYENTIVIQEKECLNFFPRD